MSAALTARATSANSLTTQQAPLLQHFDLLATAPSAVARLRELILTLAVQGKLVPQDPADEAASELLKKIRAEKDRLIAAGKIKRDKALAEISDEEQPFDLPTGWEWVRLGAIGLVGSSSRVRQSDWQSSGVPFYRAREIVKLSRDGFVSNDLFISEELFSSLSQSGWIPEEHDIMITGVGTIGVPYVVKATDRFYFKDASVLIFKNYGGLNSQYLNLLLQSPLWINGIHEYSMGTTVDTLTIVRANIALLPLPPLAEQSRIVTRVEELMRLCDALEVKGQLEAAQHAQLVSTLLGTLTASSTPGELHDNWQRVAQHFDLLLDRPAAVDALEQTLLQLAVRGLLVAQDPTDEPASTLLQKIRAEKDRLIAEGKIKRDKPLPPIAEDEKPFELPVGWEWVSVATVFDTTSGSTFDLGMEKESGAYMYVKVGDMNLPGNETEITTSSRFIDPDEKTKKALIPSGSIIFPKRGGAIATNKKRVVVTPIFVDLNTMAITPVLVLTKYAFLWLTTIDLASLNTGTSVPQINHKDIDPLHFPLPPLAEQSRIVTRVASLRRLCADLRQRLATSQTTQAQLAEALVASVASAVPSPQSPT